MSLDLKPWCKSQGALASSERELGRAVNHVARTELDVVRPRGLTFVFGRSYVFCLPCLLLTLSETQPSPQKTPATSHSTLLCWPAVIMATQRTAIFQPFKNCLIIPSNNSSHLRVKAMYQFCQLLSSAIFPVEAFG